MRCRLWPRRAQLAQQTQAPWTPAGRWGTVRVCEPMPPPVTRSRSREELAALHCALAHLGRSRALQGARGQQGARGMEPERWRRRYR